MPSPKKRCRTIPSNYALLDTGFSQCSSPPALERLGHAFGDFALLAAQPQLAHLFPQYLAADAQVVRGVLAPPSIGFEGSQDAGAFGALGVGERLFGGRRGPRGPGRHARQPGENLVDAGPVPLLELAAYDRHALDHVGQLSYVAPKRRVGDAFEQPRGRRIAGVGNRKSTRLNSSHVKISYAVFCLKKKN